MIVTPLLRSVVRKFVCHKPWWGIPIAVFYTGDESVEIIRELEKHPEIGLRPVVILSSPLAVRPDICSRCSTCGSLRRSGPAAWTARLIALPDAGSGKLLQDLETFESVFPRLMIMQSSPALYSLTVDARQLADDWRSR